MFCCTSWFLFIKMMKIEDSCEENVDVSLDERNQFYHQKMGQSSIKIKLAG